MLNQYDLLAIVAICLCVCGLILLLRRPGRLHVRVKAGKDHGAALDYKPTIQREIDK